MLHTEIETVSKQQYTYGIFRLGNINNTSKQLNGGIGCLLFDFNNRKTRSNIGNAVRARRESIDGKTVLQITFTFFRRNFK